MTDIKRLLYILLLLITISGCAKRIPLLAPIGEEVERESVERIKQEYLSRNSRFGTLKALYSASILHKKRIERLRYVFIYQKPGNLRIEILPQSGAYSLGLFIAAGGQAQFIDQQSGTITPSDSADKLLYDLLRIDLPLDDLILLLSGQIPYLYWQEIDNAEMFSAYKHGENILMLFGGDKRINAVIDAQGFLPQKIQLLDDKGKNVRYQIEYSNYVEMDGYRIPGQIFVKIVREELTINLSASNVTVNADIRKRLFDFFISLN